jgi:phospholipase
MKHSLFILFLAASPFIFSQETIKDSLQELPKPEQKAYRKAQLERALSKIWELDRED